MRDPQASISILYYIFTFSNFGYINKVLPQLYPNQGRLTVHFSRKSQEDSPSSCDSKEL